MTKSLGIAFVCLLIFVAISLFIPPDNMTEVLSAGVTVAAGYGLYRWGPAALRAFARGAKTAEEQGVIGVTLLLASIIAMRIYSVVYINLGRPEYLQLLHISPFIVYVTLIALILFIAATRYEGEKPTRLGSVAAALVAFMAVGFSSLGPFIASKLGAIISLIAHAF